MLAKRWIDQEPSPSLTAALCSGLGIYPTTSSVLVNRGIRTPDEAARFLDASLDDLAEPFSFREMDRIVRRVIKAVREDEKVLIFGDYDADGITATSLLIQFFRGLGKEVSYYIPGRLEEGYGISLPALRQIKDSGVKLIITVDCGISSVEEVAAAHAMGMDVIVTDHHEPPEVLPDAYALLDPCMKGSGYPFTSLAGVGVALKLAQAVQAGMDGKDKAGPGVDPRLMEHLDLVALGTIADVVPLRGENRILVRHGLGLLRDSRRTGIRKLKEVSMAGGSFNSNSVAFQIAPRLNASGRLGRADAGVRLLTTEDPEEAYDIALMLDTMNRERQKIEEVILDEARAAIAADGEFEASSSIVLASERWHQGVIGIVASKLVEEFYKPTVLISLSEEYGKGSARSIPAFHLYNGMEMCSHCLEGFGGHKYAAGLTIRRDRVDEFRTEFEGLVKKALNEDDFVPALRIDSEVRLPQLDFRLHEELSRVAPFGAGNPEPVLRAGRLGVLYPKVVGRNHVRMRLAGDGAIMGAIGFNMGEIYQGLAMGRVEVDAAFCLEVNEWQGERRLQLNIKDLRF